LQLAHASTSGKLVAKAAVYNWNLFARLAFAFGLVGIATGGTIVVVSADAMSDSSPPGIAFGSLMIGAGLVGMLVSAIAWSKSASY
jgi:hypothetical protein